MLAVVAVVAALVIVRVVTNSGPASGKRATTASERVLQAVSAMPARVLDEVGVGAARTPPVPINAPPLSANGRPEVLYVGAEYCPYCAAERWAMAVALSRFGTLHGVGEVHSSATDVYPSTATLRFHAASLSSSLPRFTPKEIQSNQVVNGQYAPLDKLTAAQQAIVTKYERAAVRVQPRQHSVRQHRRPVCDLRWELQPGGAARQESGTDRRRVVRSVLTDHPGGGRRRESDHRRDLPGH